MSRMIMLVGLPASGKSTVAKELSDKGYVVHSSDEIREELFGDVNDQSNNHKVFEELHDRIKRDLSNEVDVVYDATNLSRKRRVHFIKNELDNIECEKHCYLVLASYNECIDRNKKREKKVPQNVIERMYKSFETPSKYEGFDEIILKYTDDSVITYEDEEEMGNIHQYNQHHTKTVNDHCVSVSSKLYSQKSDGGLILAGLLHDIGKKFCMSFKDSNGRFSQEAHFYNHENVGAYDIFFKDSFKNNIDRALDVSLLINLHMRPHQCKSDKCIKKMIDLFGEEMWGRVMALYEADKESR